MAVPPQLNNNSLAVAAVDEVDTHDSAGARKEAALDTEAQEKHSGSDSDEPIHKDAQAGVQNIEATTTVWTKGALITAYVMIWVIYFVNTLQQGTTGTLTPYITSSFQQHSLTPTVGVSKRIGRWGVHLVPLNGS